MARLDVVWVAPTADPTIDDVRVVALAVYGVPAPDTARIVLTPPSTDRKTCKAKDRHSASTH